MRAQYESRAVVVGVETAVVVPSKETLLVDTSGELARFNKRTYKQ